MNVHLTDWADIMNAKGESGLSANETMNVTFGDLTNTPQQFVQSVLSSWWAIGKSEQDIMAEAKRRFQEDSGVK